MSRTPRQRPTRGVKQSLGSIVLGFESIVVALAALVMFGLGDLPPVLALVGGGIVAVVMLATVGLLKYPVGFAIGWVLQAIVVLSGLFNPAMFFVGALFAGMWTYCMIVGARLDGQSKEIQ